MTSLNSELQRLKVLKDLATVHGRTHAEAKAKAREHELHCLERMEAEESESSRTQGTLFTAIPDRVKGQVEDRARYIRWCLEQDEGVQEFLDSVMGTLVLASQRQDTVAGEIENDYVALEAGFYDLLVGGLELVAVKEKQDRANAQARAHIDDEAPLPPGLTFRPDPYIQQRSS